MHALEDKNHDPIGVGEGEGKEPVGCDGAVDLIRDGQDELIKADLALKVHLLVGGDLVYDARFDGVEGLNRVEADRSFAALLHLRVDLFGTPSHRHGALCRRCG